MTRRAWRRLFRGINREARRRALRDKRLSARDWNLALHWHCDYPTQIARAPVWDLWRAPEKP